MKAKSTKHVQKLGQVFLATVIAFLGMFSMAASASAKTNAPATITVADQIDEINDPRYFVNGQSFYRKHLTNGKLAYCLNWDKHIPHGQTVKLKGELDGGFLYIIKNGYPHKNITGDATADYFITQTALWWYMDDTRGTNYLSAEYKSGAQNGSWFQNIVDLKNAAQQHKTYEKPSLAVSVSNTNLKLDNKKEYFVSEAVTVTTSNVAGNYNVTVSNAPKGTMVVNEQGQKQTSFAQGSKFLIKVPVGTFDEKLIQQATVTVSATGSIDKAYEYAPDDPSYYQHVFPIEIYPETTDLSKSVTFKGVSTRVKISKLDITNKKELPGATLLIKDQKGKEIEKWISTDQPHYINNLPAGTYTLVETIAPKGYVLSTEQIQFDVAQDGKVVEVVMNNTPETPVPITASGISPIIYIGGILAMLFGSGVIYYHVKVKKQ